MPLQFRIELVPLVDLHHHRVKLTIQDLIGGVVRADGPLQTGRGEDRLLDLLVALRRGESADWVLAGLGAALV